MGPEELNQSLTQKKIAFATNEEMVEAVMSIIREGMRHERLVGETEFATVVNAVTLDAQSDLLIKFSNAVDFIRKGGLHETNG